MNRRSYVLRWQAFSEAVLIMMMNDFGNQSNVQTSTPPEVENEFFMLMSLALDDMLDEDDRLRFDNYLNHYPALAEQWQAWQEMDATFQATPSAMPPEGFVADVELRILQRERQQSLLWGLGLGVVVLALWVGLVAGAVSFGAFVMFNQAEWLSGFVHLLAQSTATVGSWWSATMITFNALLSTDQARILLMAYGVTAALMLGGWVIFLRRSTRSHESAAPAYTRSA